MLLPPAAEDLLSLDMLSAADGWTVGRHFTIAHWDATRWTQVINPANLDLVSVRMVSPTEGWAVGNWLGVNGFIHWNGSGWTDAVTPASWVITGLDMVSATDGWAVGENGALLRYIPPPAPVSYLPFVPAVGATNVPVGPVGPASWPDDVGRAKQALGPGASAVTQASGLPR